MSTRKLFCTLLFFAGIFFLSHAKNNNYVFEDTLVKNKRQYLELRGIVRKSVRIDQNGEKFLDSAAIKTYNEKNILVSLNYTDKKGKCKIKLPLNKGIYTVEISKPGCVSKIILVDTQLPPEKKLIYVIPFDLSIFEEVKGLDVSVLKNPVAKIIYNETISQFDYDVSYTNEVNANLKKMYSDYYFLLKVDKDFNDSIGPGIKKANK